MHTRHFPQRPLRSTSHQRPWAFQSLLTSQKLHFVRSFLLWPRGGLRLMKALALHLLPQLRAHARLTDLSCLCPIDRSSDCMLLELVT